MNRKIISTFALILSLSICTGLCGKIVNAGTLIDEDCAVNKIAFAQKIAKTNTKQNVNKKTPVNNQKQIKTTPKAPAALNSASVQNKTIIPTTSLYVVANPDKFLNKTIKMQATFDKFSTLGLDYKKALRSSEDYIGILIQRDDVIDHNIPLSEMKLFLPKTLAEKHIDLDTGDKIEITAKEFSTALGDPWLDVENITIIKKVKPVDDKNKK